MSKILKRGTFIALCAMLLVACNKNNEVSTDDETTATLSDATTSTNQNDEVASDSNDENMEDNIIVRPVAKDYIQSAIDYANKIGGEGRLYIDDNGNVYVPYSEYSGGILDRYLSYLYSCYGKDIKQVRQRGDELLILTSDGNVYHDCWLVIEGENVSDMLWVPHDNYYEAYCIYGNGKFTYYNADYDKPTNDFSEDFPVTTGCVWGSTFNRIDYEGNSKITHPYWKNFDIKGWKDIVVFACMANDNTKKSCIAGISADGKVYAAGDYADEILSWGELAYISMDDDLIVGMKKDGTLVFAGENALYYQGKDICPVKGIRLYRGTMYAITENGTMTSRYEGKRADVDISYESFEHMSGLKMDTDGNIYTSVYNGESYNWEPSNYIKAAKDKAHELTLYQSLLSWKNHKGELDSFLVKDFNNDGKNDVMCKVIVDNKVEINIYENKGGLECIYSKNSVLGYYPNSGIVVWKDESSGSTSHYIDLINDSIIGKINLSRAGNEYYFDGSSVTLEEFDKLLDEWVKGEQICYIEDSMFLEPTEENLRNSFLK